MRQQNSLPVHELPSVYRFDGLKVPYSIWLNCEPAHVTTVLFLGTVQIGKIPGWIAASCPPGTAVVQGAPHWHAPKEDGSDIPDFMFGFTETAFTAVTHHAKSVTHIIADSQAAPGVMRLLAQHRYGVNQLTLLQPLGLNAATYSGTYEAQLVVFKARIRHNTKHQLGAALLDRRLRYNHSQMLRHLNFKSAKTWAQYSAGLLYDSTNDLKKVVSQNVHVVIICGANDGLFPPDEIKQSLKAADIAVPITIIPRLPHSPLIAKAGAHILARAFRAQTAPPIDK